MSENRKLIQEVIDEMTGSIPGVIPRELGQAIRDKIPNQIVWNNSIPVLGSFYLSMNTYLIPDGSIRLELLGPSGDRLWFGTLKPAQ